MILSRIFRGALSLGVLAALLMVPAFSGQAQAAAKQAAKAAPAKQAKVDETPQQIEVKLIAFAKTHLARANSTLRPNKANPEVRARESGFVATYLEVDESSLATEMTPSNTPGCLYVGHVIYHERVFESVAVSKGDATKGPYNHVKTRRVLELTRYDSGKWHY